MAKKAAKKKTTKKKTGAAAIKTTNGDDDGDDDGAEQVKAKFAAGDKPTEGRWKPCPDCKGWVRGALTRVCTNPNGCGHGFTVGGKKVAATGTATKKKARRKKGGTVTGGELAILAAAIGYVESVGSLSEAERSLALLRQARNLDD